MIETVFLDIDGILTDGHVWVNAKGEETKKISFDDIDAVFEIKRSGIKLGFITGEDSPFCDYVRERFSPDFFLRACKDKLSAFQELAVAAGLKRERTCYVGDSKKDIELLKHVAYGFAPADVDDSIREAAQTVLNAGRGQGVVREVAERVMKVNEGHALS